MGRFLLIAGICLVVMVSCIGGAAYWRHRRQRKAALAAALKRGDYTYAARLSLDL